LIPTNSYPNTNVSELQAPVPPYVPSAYGTKVLGMQLSLWPTQKSHWSEQSAHTKATSLSSMN